MDNFRIEFDEDVYAPGMNVTGKVIIQNKEPLKVSYLKICISGTAHNYWNHNEERAKLDSHGYSHVHSENVVYNALINYVKGEVIAWKASETQDRLPSGMNVFPFAFWLPVGCPPSTKGKAGCIQYLVSVELDRPWSLKKEAKAAFKVTAISDLNSIPKINNPMVNRSTRMTGFLKKDSTEMSVTIPKGGFVPGESIPITFTLMNRTSRPFTDVKTKIIQVTTFKSSPTPPPNTSDGAIKYKDNGIKKETKIVAKNRTPKKIGVGSEKTFTHYLAVPSLTPSFNNCPITSVDYCLTAKMESGGALGLYDMKVEFPIMIGTIPVNTLPNGGSVAIVASAPPASPITAPAAPYPVVQHNSTETPYPVQTTVAPPTYEESMNGIGIKVEDFGQNSAVYDSVPSGIDEKGLRF